MELAAVEHLIENDCYEKVNNSNSVGSGYNIFV